MRMIFFIIISVTNILVAQTDWKRWQKIETDYSIPLERVEEGSNSDNSTSPLSILKGGYSFFISDLDGDNCPFYPTCSSFYVESVSKTNILKGTLMFADRFTRDSNIFKTHEHYPVYINGKLFDPTYNYTLIDSTIIYYSREKLVK